MKIAVTGATGFIGSHLVEALVGRGHEVTCLARSPEKTSELSGLPLRFVYGSLDEPRALAGLVDDQEAVLHVAGLTKAPNLQEYVRVNVAGTENLLCAIRGNGAHLRRFLFFSSAEAMGPSPGGLPLTEEADPRPFSAYGKSKIMAEKCLDSLSGRLPGDHHPASHRLRSAGQGLCNPLPAGRERPGECSSPRLPCTAWSM